MPVKRICAISLVLLASAPTLADEREPEDGIARPDAEDLRHGDLLLSVSGGVWAPSAPFTPAFQELGSLDVGGTAHGHLGFGLGRYLVLGIDGGFAMVPSTDTACAACGATSIDVGPSLAFHPTQGFALDPWVSYGMAYRHTIISLDSTSVNAHALDLMRLAIGADYYPVGLFGFGPYVEVDVGIRDFDAPVSYATVHAGLRVTIDPFQAGTSFTPGVATSR